LARTTSDENTQLNDKLRDLEVEVAVWKQQAIASKNAQDYEIKPVFRRSVAFENGVEGKDKNIALCVIDGTRSVFSPNYLFQGGEGGRKAGQEIVQGIIEHLANDGSLQVANIKVSIVIYVMRSRLRNELIAGDTCTAEQFEGFFVGLNETRHLNVVDVGTKSDADRKIEDYLQLFAGLTQTVRVFFGGSYNLVVPSITDLTFIRDCSGGNSSHYLSVMATLEACNASSKLVILRSQTGSPYGASARIPFIMLPGLSHPPATEHYLMTTCSKEGRCRYSHEYNLTDDQLATLAKNAKQSPCWFLNNDRECPFGPSCCWGHVCPFGIKCHYSLKDKCRFKGRE
ncbi:hypothetical protein EDB86DRAFT_2800923, partial [Lactarius hatsudake]